LNLSFRKYCDILEEKDDTIFASVIHKLCQHLLKRTYTEYSKQKIKFGELAQALGIHTLIRTLVRVLVPSSPKARVSWSFCLCIISPSNVLGDFIT
jgi:hypothetical protein